MSVCDKHAVRVEAAPIDPAAAAMTIRATSMSGARRAEPVAVPRLIIENRQFNGEDQRTIIRARASEPLLRFDHVGRRS